MKLHHRILSSLLYGLIRLFGHLPINILYFKASILQFIAEKVLRYRYQVIIQNLSRSFPEKNYQEIRELAHGFYKHFFEVFAEVIKSQGMKPAEAQKQFNIENMELIDDLQAKGINIIALGGHWGNWEWLMMVPLFFKFNTYSLYKPLSNKIAEILMGRIRKRFGMRLLPMQQAGRYILSRKDYPAIYFFIGDQSPSHRDPEYCFDFLNQPSLFFSGGAKLAKATKSAVIYHSVDKTSAGLYAVSYQLIYQPGDDMSDKDILRKYAQLLEADIRNKPTFWLWSHKRWKHKVASK